MPEFTRTYTIQIEDYEPNNIYPGSKENVRVICKETGYDGGGTFKACHLRDRNDIVAKCLSEIFAREISTQTK